MLNREYVNKIREEKQSKHDEITLRLTRVGFWDEEELVVFLKNHSSFIRDRYEFSRYNENGIESRRISALIKKGLRHETLDLLFSSGSLFFDKYIVQYLTQDNFNYAFDKAYLFNNHYCTYKVLEKLAEYQDSKRIEVLINYYVDNNMTVYWKHIAPVFSLIPHNTNLLEKTFSVISQYDDSEDSQKIDFERLLNTFGQSKPSPEFINSVIHLFKINEKYNDNFVKLLSIGEQHLFKNTDSVVDFVRYNRRDFLALMFVNFHHDKGQTLDYDHLEDFLEKRSDELYIFGARNDDFMWLTEVHKKNVLEIIKASYKKFNISMIQSVVQMQRDKYPHFFHELYSYLRIMCLYNFQNMSLTFYQYYKERIDDGDFYSNIDVMSVAYDKLDFIQYNAPTIDKVKIQQYYIRIAKQAVYFRASKVLNYALKKIKNKKPVEEFCQRFYGKSLKEI